MDKKAHIYYYQGFYLTNRRRIRIAYEPLNIIRKRDFCVHFHWLLNVIYSRTHTQLMCVYCNRSQKTSQRVDNNDHATQQSLLRLVSYVFVLYTLRRHP